MPTDPKEHVTQILRAIQTDPAQAGKLLPVVYEELRAIARDRLRQERAGHTLQATALVHEAYMRLVGSDSLPWQNRAHFFGACANAMRQILVEHARRRGAKKRGGSKGRESLTNADVGSEEDLALVLSIDESLEALRAEDARAAQVVELRFFGGLEMEEIAHALEISERTVHREWAFAKARLAQMLGDSTDLADDSED
jgi:RNA polymerase sigma factor (TIGR02999 family)